MADTERETMRRVKVGLRKRIRVIRQDGTPGPWLASYHDTLDGRGNAKFTEDREKAMVFENVAEAFAFWHQTSRHQPQRADGKPNRPLTAFTVTIE